MSSLNTQSASDRLKAGLLRAIRPRNDENSSDQITQKNTWKSHSTHLFTFATFND